MVIAISKDISAKEFDNLSNYKEKQIEIARS